MNESRTLKTKQARDIWRSVWLALFAIVLTLTIVQPIPLTASPHLQDDNHIVLPADGQVVVNFISTHAVCTGDFGLYSPQEILIYPDYLYSAGLPFPLPGYFLQGTELVFYITPRDFCSGGPYLSTNPNRARITHPDSNTWIIAWEDWTDADFNDLIVQVDFQPVSIPFLDLPYHYTRSTFVDESRDTEQGGKVNAYVDHEYPTYHDPPNTDYPNTVNFYGYDSSQTNPPPPYNIAYNGHNGIDYYLPHNTPVLAAASGTVIFASQISEYCWLTRRVETANVIKIQHDNGYVTQYWHLDHFAEGITVGTEVGRDAERPIGYVGKTGCATGYHLHFMVKNPEGPGGIVVDPYGWNPRPDAAWYGRTDPWQEYHFEQSGPDATSHYLWTHPLETVTLVDPSASTVITSTSGHVMATVPAGAYSAPLRIELAEALQSARIPGYRSVWSFSLFGYTIDDVPVTTLAAEVTLDVYMPTDGVQTSAMNATTPALQIWDAQASIWRELPTTWDALTGSARATSSQIGTFALSLPEYLTNSSFEEDGRIPAPWKAKKLTPKDKRVCNKAHYGSCSFQMVGTTANKSLQQVVNISGSAGDSFTLSGWSKAKKPSSNGGAYCAEAKAFYNDGTKDKFKTCFTKSSHAWEYREKAFTAAKDYNKIVVYLTYKKQSGRAWFDDVRLVAQ